jgi:hypothetical protein
MPHSFDLSIECPASVEQVLSAFGDEDYWQARLATFGGGTATLGALNVDPSGTVAATITISLLRDRLPKMVTQLHRGDLKMVRNERWSPIGDGRVRGEINVAMPGTPFSAFGEALVAPRQDGSRLQYCTTVEVRIPLVGGKIESYMSGQTAEEITRLQHFTTKWIAENY